MPPWNNPNNAEMMNSEVIESKGMNSSNATPCNTEPSNRVRRPPMRSQIRPEISRLTTPKASISDSICAPRAAP